jgi:hypothetical protein
MTTKMQSFVRDWMVTLTTAVVAGTIAVALVRLFRWLGLGDSPGLVWMVYMPVGVVGGLLFRRRLRRSIVARNRAVGSPPARLEQLSEASTSPIPRIDPRRSRRRLLTRSSLLAIALLAMYWSRETLGDLFGGTMNEPCDGSLVKLFAPITPKTCSPVDLPRASTRPRSLGRPFVGLALSGGGSRAANFSMGVLQELEDLAGC